MDWMELAARKQEDIAKDFAKEAACSPEEFVTAMRFQPVDTFTPIWRKHNRAAMGYTEVGQLAKDCALWSLHTNSYCRLLGTHLAYPLFAFFYSDDIHLIDFLPLPSSKPQYTIVVAGSYS